MPNVVTSRNNANRGGGYLNQKRTIRKVKQEALESALEAMDAPDMNVEEVLALIAKKQKLLKRTDD